MISNLFPYSVGCLFLIMPFEAQKFLILMNLIYFSFYFLVLLFLKTCIIQVHDLIQHFLVRDFLVLLLTFRSLLYFELIFAYGMR